MPTQLLVRPPLLDDLKWRFFVLTGVVLGYLVFGDGETGLLRGAVSVVIVLNLWRAVSRRRHRPVRAVASGPWSDVTWRCARTRSAPTWA